MYSYTELMNKFYRGTNLNKLAYKLENNTYVIKTNKIAPTFDITLHGSPIAQIKQDKIVLSSCGWYTMTTKDRLNKILSDNQTGYTIYQVSHIWYIYANNPMDNYIPLKNRGKVKFADGVEFMLCGDNIWRILNIR